MYLFIHICVFYLIIIFFLFFLGNVLSVSNCGDPLAVLGRIYIFIYLFIDIYMFVSIYLYVKYIQNVSKMCIYIYIYIYIYIGNVLSVSNCGDSRAVLGRKASNGTIAAFPLSSGIDM
jgi:hypothetical protein